MPSRRRFRRLSRALALLAAAAGACLCSGCEERAISLESHQRICSPSMTDYETDLTQSTDAAYLPTPGN
jgi:hypothetical protein